MTRSDYSNQAAPQAWFLHDEPDLETKQIAPYIITHFHFIEDFRKRAHGLFPISLGTKNYTLMDLNIIYTEQNKKIALIFMLLASIQ